MGTEPSQARKGRGSGGTSPIFLASAHQGKGECGQRGTGRAWCWPEPSPAGSGQACVCQGPRVSLRPHLLLPPAPQLRRKTADRPRGGAGMMFPMASSAPGPGSRPGWEDWSIGPQPPPPRRYAHLLRWVRATGHPLHPSPERLPHRLGQQISSPRSVCGTPPQPSLVHAGPLCHLPGPREGRRDRLP